MRNTAPTQLPKINLLIALFSYTFACPTLLTLEHSIKHVSLVIKLYTDQTYPLTAGFTVQTNDTLSASRISISALLKLP